MRGRVLAGVALLPLAASIGCGYSLAGRGSFLPSYIRSIGIPMFVNHSQVFDLEQALTERVRAEFVGRGRYEVRPTDTGTDAVLKGEIVSMTIAPSGFNSEQQATRYAASLTARLEFRDMKTNKVLWENPNLVYREEYDVVTAGSVTDPGAFFGQDRNALDRLATEFARNLVSAVLEAF